MTGNVWIARLDDATVDESLAASRGPLAGRRLAVKDNIDVAGFATTAGCPSFAFSPATTAPAVARLIDQGATVVGKTNLDQFATGLVGTRSPYGAVDNPVRPGFISGGSSSGSAVAVALGQADLGIATDTAGSGRVPAALCGLVGLKGTRGWVPNAGVVPACVSFDCTTVLARTVGEAARALRIMSGPHPLDPSSRLRPSGRFGPVERIGIVADGGLDGCDEQIVAAYRQAIDDAAKNGFETAVVDLSAYFEAGELLYDGAFVAERHAAVGDFVEKGSDDLDPTVAAIVRGSASITASSFAADRRRLGALAVAAHEIWSEVDAVMLPTVPHHPSLGQVAADPIGVNLNLGRFVTGANLVDWCAAAIPVGNGSEPVGVQLLGPAWSDEAIWCAAATMVDEQPLLAPDSENDVLIAVAGAHLDGQPLNHQLTRRGGRLAGRARTAAAYRLVVLDGPLPKPGLLRDSTVGASIELELWSLDHLGFGEFVSEVPAPLSIGTIELDDGRAVQGFLCESEAAASAPDISGHGGWLAWLATVTR